MRRGAGDGRPRNVPVYWDRMVSSLKNATWTHKGLAADCPFCGAAFEPQKMRFLIFFHDDGRFKSFNCFICPERGSGLQGLSKIARQVDAGLSFMELIAMSGTNPGEAPGYSEALAPSADDGRVGDAEEGAPIDWPPAWVKDTDSVFVRGLEYMERRGIKDAPSIVDRFGLLFSEVVEIMVRNDPYVKEFPCLVAPSAGADGEVYGWSARLLGEPKAGETKVSAMRGQGWRHKTLFGIREIDPKLPVTIVEGMFSALSTPNAVAVGGKEINVTQLDLLAETGARVFVFALDPFVDHKKFSNAMYRLRQKLPGCSVLRVEWERFGGNVDADPNDRGIDQMRDVIARTVMSAMRKD